MDFTPALRKQALETLQRFEHGPLFTPPSLSNTLVLPGVFGAANWGGGGFDPETGVLYVPSRMAMTIIRAVANDPAASNLPYAVAFSQDDPARIDGLPIFKPPYSRLTAIDMKTGEHKWMTPLGNGPRNHPLLKDLELGPLGDEIQLAGILVTKTLVVVSTMHLAIDGSPAEPPWAKWGDPDLTRKTLRIFDKDSGALLRVFEIPGGGAGPMTYLQNGKQYLVVATGGGTESALVAFAVEPVAAAAH
jgi:quinoprotein glucose dehydrogenase